MATKKKTTKKAVTVDFTGVDKGTKRRIPAGDYAFKVDKCYEDVSQSGNNMVVFECVISEGKHKGFRAWVQCAITPKALWKLRQMLEALGVEVPQGKFKLVPKKYVGLEFGATVEDDTYEGKTRSKIADVFQLDELDSSTKTEDEDDDEDDDEDEDDEEIDDEDEDEDDDD